MCQPKWSKPIKLNLENIKDLRGKSGIYKIFLDDRSIKSIHRFRGNDPDKIMCIGKSENLKSRLYGFLRGIDKGKGHSEGNLMWLVNQNHKVETKFHFSYHKCEKPELSEKESIAIYQYIQRFGEVPVLNSSIPSREETIEKVKNGKLGR
jgi:hypothetical protein